MGKRNRDAPRGRRQVLQLDRAPARAPWETEEEPVPTQQPPQWQEVKEEGSGDVYYWNIVTGETTWERPAELEAQLAGPATSDTQDIDEVDDVLDQLEKEVVAPPKPPQASAQPPAADKGEAKEEAGNALSLMGGYDSDSDDGGDEAAQDAKTAEKEPEKGEAENGEPEKMEVEGEQAVAQGDDTAADAGESAAEGKSPSTKEEDQEPKEVVKKPVSFTVIAKEKPKGDVTEARAALKQLQEKSPTQCKPKQQDGEADKEAEGKEPDDGDVDDFLRELEGDGVGAGETEEKAVTEEGDGGGATKEEGDEEASAFQKPAAVASAFQKPAPVMKLQRSLSPPSEEEKEDGELVASEEDAKEDEDKRAEAGRVEEEDRRVLEECFHTVLALREEGEVLVSRLKASVAEEAPTAGGRRDVLLTLLGGMLSWGGCVQEVGLLVSQEMTGAMARASLAFLGKLKQRLEKCAAELEKQETARAEEEIEVLPKGWKKMAGAQDGAVLYCNESSGVLQQGAPEGTKLRKRPDPANAEEERRQEEEEEHAALVAALPSGEGEVQRGSLLIYIQPVEECSVERIHLLFPQPDASVIRIIGSGFVAVSFLTDLECEIGRDQALAEHRGIVRDLPSLMEWALLSTSSPVVVARCACKGDKIDRYPISYKRAEQPPPSTSVSPSVSPFVSDSSPFPPPTSAPHLSANPWDPDAPSDRPDSSAKPANAVKVKAVKGKLGKKGFSQQLAKWRQKQSELEPEEEEKQMTLAQLEQEKKRKAHQWFTEQLEAGADGGVNPNLIPVKRKKL